MTAPGRVVRCRYLRRNNEQCTGEVVHPGAEVLLCAKHLGRALGLLRAAIGIVTK